MGSVIHTRLEASTGDGSLLVITYRLRPGNYRIVSDSKAVR